MTRFRLTASQITRRRLLQGTAAGAGLALSGLIARPAIAQAGRPAITHGVMSGDVEAGRGIVWSRADRPSRMVVEWSTTDSFRDPRRVVGPAALQADDYTARVDLTDLPAGQDIFYRVQFQDLADVNVLSEPAMGRFRSAPAAAQDITFVWTGDTAGQGWGINLDWGGMRGYATMLDQQPAFLIHSGDSVYADGPLQETVELPDGSIWRNVMTEEKSKVAETLQEFRGQYQYNRMDDNVRAFYAAVPMFAQWDDHETVNNWYPNEILEDERYSVRSVALLSERARRAFLDYMPIRPTPQDPERIYRKINYGPLLDVFFLDMRSYRADNSANDQAERGPATSFLGREQVNWLKRELLNSRATWKIIASDMPIGIMVRDGEQHFENGANGDGPVRGREHDIADLLSFMKHSGIRNTVWLTADVHYTAAHYYDPNQAVFQDFEPFWEFVSGPIHAGSYGPGDMDNTFGPQVRFTKDPGGVPNLPPSEGLQFFGRVDIAADTGVMTVTLKDIADADLFTVELEPQA